MLHMYLHFGAPVPPPLPNAGTSAGTSAAATRARSADVCAMHRLQHSVDARLHAAKDTTPYLPQWYQLASIW